MQNITIQNLLIMYFTAHVESAKHYHTIHLMYLPASVECVKHYHTKCLLYLPTHVEWAKHYHTKLTFNDFDSTCRECKTLPYKKFNVSDSACRICKNYHTRHLLYLPVRVESGKHYHTKFTFKCIRQRMYLVRSITPQKLLSVYLTTLV